MITDLSYLKSMSNNDNDFIQEMIDIFKEQILEYASEMPKLLENSEYLKLSQMAHKAKSSVAVMGMENEKELLNKLEINAKNGSNTETYKNLLDTFLLNAQEAIIELDDHMKLIRQ